MNAGLPWSCARLHSDPSGLNKLFPALVTSCFVRSGVSSVSVLLCCLLSLSDEKSPLFVSPPSPDTHGPLSAEREIHREDLVWPPGHEAQSPV